MRKLLTYLQTTLATSPAGARAFVVLVGIAILIYTANVAIKFWPASNDNLIRRNKELEQEVMAWLKQTGGLQTADPDPIIFSFNPNTISADSLKLLGFSALITNRILSYRSKVDPFSAKEDLKKIYGLPEDLYRALYDSIDLPAKYDDNRKVPAAVARNKISAENLRPNTKKYTYIRPTVERFDINLADTVTLSQIRGIGPVLSSRILKFRDKLGGYTTTEQVRKVYGLSPEVADSLLAYAYINKSFKPKLIAINEASPEELAAHPYISFSIAKRIVSYRQQHGKFNDPADLLAVHGISPEEWEKVTPYLTFE